MTKRQSRFEPRVNTIGSVVSIVLSLATAQRVTVTEMVSENRAGVARTRSVLAANQKPAASGDVDETQSVSFAHKSEALVNAVSPPYSLPLVAR